MRNIKFTLVVALLMFCVKIGYSLTATVTVYWHGGWCTVCGTDYSCSTGVFSGTWNGGNNTFFDPLPAGATCTWVSITTCEADCGATSVPVSLDGTLIGTYSPNGSCACYGSLNYTVSGCPPTNYVYQGNNTLHLAPNNTICVSHSTITLTYTMVSPVITASGPLNFCSGGSVTLTAPNGNSYLWSNGITTQNDVITTAGSWSVTVTNANGCTAVYGPVVTTITGGINPTITENGPVTFCQGGSVTLTCSNATSYLWNTGAVTQGITVTTSGTYWVTATNASGCTGVSSHITVTVLPIPTPVITPSGPVTFCQGGSVTLTSTAGNSYLWSTGAVTQSITVTTSGTYNVTVTNGSNCTGAATAVTVTVNPLPTPTITASGPTTFCTGGSVTLTCNPAGSSYLWSNGAVTQSIVVTTSGTFTVTLTDANGCVGTSAPITVTVNPAPVVTITASGPTTFCQGGSVTLTSTAGSSYLWSTGAITQSIVVTTSGVYTVTMTNGNGCAGTSAPITVTVNPLPTPTITASGPITFCNGGNVTLTCNPAGSSYLWSNGAVTQSITVNASGTFTVTLTDANGCVGTSAPITVTVNPLPVVTITPSGPTTFCNGGSVTLTSTAGSSYLWSNGAVTQSIVVTTSGTYTVTMTDANGCVGTSAPITVTVNPAPVVTITASGPTTFCQGGSVTLTSTAGSSYLWSTGAITQSIVVNTSGVYTVTMTNGNGCAGTSAPITVTVNPLPTPTITASGPTTFCNGGNVILTCNPAGSSYLWSNGAITQSITVTTSGTFTVTLTDANGCVGTSAPITVTVNPLPVVTITASGPTTFCQGGSVTLTSTAGSSYLWSTGAITQSIVVNTSGTYTVTMTNGNGCVGTSAPITVTVNPLPVVTITASGPTTFCQGGSVTLTSTAGNSYLWSTGAITQSIVVNTSGTYTVTMTNGNGCVATSAPITVTVNPLPVVTITAGGPTTFCQGGSVVLTSTTGSSYLWSTGAITQSITVTTSGTYSVTMTDANGCVGNSAPITVTVNPLPVVTITASGPTTFCQGGSVTLTSTAGSSYLWSTGAITQSIVVNTSGTFTVTMTNGNGCVGTSAPITVTVNPLPVVTITAGGPTTFCQGGSVVLTSTAGSSYLWSNGAITQSITVTTSGNYTVTMTDANGCVGNSAPITVTVNPLPTPVITASGPLTFCTGGSVTLTCTVGSSYLWSTGAITQAITVTTSGTYTVTMTDGNGCVGTSASVTVTVNNALIPTITAGGPTTFCQGGSVTLTASAGASYLWSTGAITQSITVNASGNYSVNVTDVNGCNGNSAVTTVTVNPLPTPTITAGGPTTFCQGGNVVLTCTAGSSYLWSTGAITQSITVTTSGTYTVTMTDGNGCVGTSPGITVTVNPLPVVTITAGGPTSFCQGGSVTLTSTGGSSYLWSTGAITQSIVVNTSGTYTVTMTDANGCAGTSAGTTVTVHPLPTPTITAGGPTTFCQGGNVTLTCTAGSSYLWSTGAITQSITVNTSGTYTVTMTDANGCVGTSAGTTVTVNPLPNPTITAGGPTTFCQGGNVVLTCTAGSSYLWSTGAITQSITVTTSGTYTVTMTDANGCIGTTAGTTVTVNSLPIVTITAGGPTSFCQGGNVVLTSTAGSSYLWSTGAITQSITVNTSGTYTVSMTNANGCVGTSAGTTVTVHPLPTPTITAGGPATFCAGGNVTLTCTAGSSYLWSNGAITQSITVNTTGNYTVTMTDANGCVGTSAATAVTVNPLPTPTITAGGPTSFCAGGSVTLTCTAGSSYLWSTGAITQAITVTTSGTYTVTMTDANGCQGTSAGTTVTVHALPTPAITAGGPTSFCTGGDVVLTCTPAGASYLWSTGAVSQSITVTTSGNYTVTLTDANGCVGNSAAIAITVNPLPTPTITAGGPTSFCQGGNVVLTCTAGASYVWSTGANTQSITVTNPGTYTVIMTDVNGCVGASPSVAVTVNALPLISLGPDRNLCGGQSAILSAGNPGSTYLWSTGANTQTISVSTAGTYWVQVSNGNCSASDTLNITTNGNPVVNLGPDIKMCSGVAPVTLDAGNPGMSYLWSSGENSETISPTTSGTYWVRVESNGCFGYDTINIAIGNPINFSLGNDTSICPGDQLVIDAGKEFATYAWAPGGESTHFIIVNQPGRYICEVGDTNGCTASAVKMVIEFCPTDMYVPSGFSPDGIAGKNATFMAYCNGATEFHMYIYDRWGGLDFESTDISVGWDGTINGTPAMEGVYVYRIDYKTYNNVELQKHTKTGTVTLVR